MYPGSALPTWQPTKLRHGGYRPLCRLHQTRGIDYLNWAMRFRCAICNFGHDGVTSNALTKTDGTTATVPWFVEPNGLRISATVCLQCGTTFGTHGAPLKALFSLGTTLITIKYTFSPSQLADLASRHPDSVPDAILSLLTTRGFLEQGTKAIRFGDIVSDREARALVFVIEQAVRQFVAFCDAAVGGDLSEQSLALFIDVSHAFEQAGELNAHTEACAIVKNLLKAASVQEVLHRAHELRLRGTSI